MRAACTGIAKWPCSTILLRHLAGIGTPATRRTRRLQRPHVIFLILYLAFGLNPARRTIMAITNPDLRMHETPPAAIERRCFRNCFLAISLLASSLPAYATPAPPPLAPLLHQARMTATVRLIEAKDGHVSKISTLCTVSGKIPVYADTGGPASFNPLEIEGCTMPRNGQNLSVSVWGAKAISKAQVAFATAGVSVTPPGALPACANLCGPQPLADSRAEVRASGNPKSIKFSLNPNPVSVLAAKPRVWLEADVEIID